MTRERGTLLHVLKPTAAPRPLTPFETVAGSGLLGFGLLGFGLLGSGLPVASLSRLPPNVSPDPRAVHALAGAQPGSRSRALRIGFHVPRMPPDVLVLELLGAFDVPAERRAAAVEERIRACLVEMLELALQVSIVQPSCRNAF